MIDDVKNADSDYDDVSSQESLPPPQPVDDRPPNEGSEQLEGPIAEENDDPD